MPPKSRAPMTALSCSTIVHNGPGFPSPIRLRPAIGTEAVLPEGEGIMFIPAPAPFHFYGFRTFYSPHLNTTLLSECDIHTGLGLSKSAYSGVSHQHYYIPGTWTAIAHHKRSKAKNVILHGVVRCGKKLTHPIIRPSIDVADPPTRPRFSVHKICPLMLSAVPWKKT
jgi:hypothetical protein